MILITGGAHQGKQKIARNLWEQKKEAHNTLEPVIAAGDTEDQERLLQAEIIVQFHLWIYKMTENGTDPYPFVHRLFQENPQVIFTLDQVGCGVVPMDAFDRKYREMVGRIGCLLADQAKEVYLVTCGIARKIK